MAKFGYNTWQPLQQGDTVYIIAPSAGFDSPLETEKMLSTAKRLLESFGLKAIWDPHVFSKKDPLCPERAMDKETAFSDLMKAFKDPCAKAVWTIRGGRLSCELWDFLDQVSLSSLPKKPLIGFSDTTSLHLWFNLRGYPTIHGPVLAYGLETTPTTNKLASFKPLIDILMGNSPLLSYKGLTPVNAAANNLKNIIRAPLVGGNLSSLHYYQSIYKETSFPHIMMIETMDDYTRIDSILYALKRGQFFAHTQAMILGALHDKPFEDPSFKEIQEVYDKTIQRFGQTMPQVPIYFTALTDDGRTFQFGHGDYNHPFPLGTYAELGKYPENDEIILKIAAS